MSLTSAASAASSTPSHGDEPTPEQLIERIIALRPTLVEAQEETERRTYYSPDLHQYFLDNDLYRVMIPRRFGGLEFDFPTFIRMQIEMARGCPSTGWCWGLTSSHALQTASYFSEKAQAAVFGSGDFRCASVASPDVVATWEDGWWRLNGTVRYCSGIPYATHFLGQAVIDGLPPEEAANHMLLYIAPRSEFTVLEDWGDTLGLRGSGSQGITFTDGRIPAHCALEDTTMVDVDVTAGTPGVALHGNPLYGGKSLAPFTISLGAMAVGAGFNALDEYEHQMRTRKTPLPPMVPRITDANFQRWYGAAYGKLVTAEAAVMRAAHEHMELARKNAAGTKPYTTEDDQRVAIVAREATVQAWEAVEQELVRSVGSSPMRAGQRFERVYRDLSMIASHRNTAYRELMFQRIAQLHLGIEA